MHCMIYHCPCIVYLSMHCMISLHALHDISLSMHCMIYHCPCIAWYITVHPLHDISLSMHCMIYHCPFIAWYITVHSLHDITVHASLSMHCMISLHASLSMHCLISLFIYCIWDSGYNPGQYDASLYMRIIWVSRMVFLRLLSRRGELFHTQQLIHSTINTTISTSPAAIRNAHQGTLKRQTHHIQLACTMRNTHHAIHNHTNRPHIWLVLYHTMDCFMWSSYPWPPMELTPVSTTFMFYDSFTVGNDVARTHFCDITMGYDIAMNTYYDITMHTARIFIIY